MKTTLAFLAGVYLAGLFYTYVSCKDALDFGSEPEWQKRLAAAALALIWPLGAAFGAFHFIKETVCR